MKRILQVTAVTALTILFLALFLWNSNLRDVWRILKSTNALWFAIGLVVNFWALIFRTIRWRLLIDDMNPPPFYPTFFANTIGYFLSSVLPIRAGDVARPALLARRTPVRFADALGTVLTERVLDLISILALFLFFCVRHWREFDNAVIHGGAVGAGLMLFGSLALLVAIYFFRGTIRRMHEGIGRILPLRFREAWMRFFDAFAVTIRMVHKPAAFVIVLLSTAGIWFCLIAQYWCVFIASHRLLPLDSALFLTAVTTVGVAIPTPGGVGGFHKLCQWALETYYHFDVDTSVAVAVLLHVVSTLPVIVTGVALMLREGLNWRELKRETAADET